MNKRMPEQQLTTKSHSSSSFMTPVVCCILVTETAERFSYFGFRAILVLYFTTSLQYEESLAISLFAYAGSLAYATPLLGALLADGILGRYRTILYFGLLYCVGLGILTTGTFIMDNMEWKRGCTFVGLFFICIGTGGIKPCVSAFGADQVANASRELAVATTEENIPEAAAAQHGTANDEFPVHAEQEIHHGLVPEQELQSINPDQDHQVRAFFAYFYFCINLGAVTSISAVPLLKAYFGFGVAFLAPTVFLIFAMLAFLSKRKEYVHHVPGEGSSSLANTFRLCWWLLQQRLRLSYPGLMRFIPSWGEYRHVLSSREEEGGIESTSTAIVRSSSDEMFEDNSISERNDERQYNLVNPSQEQLADAAQFLHVLPILALIPTFWMLYDQQGSVWTLQATRMELHGLQAEQLTLVNPVEIMIFIPLFDRCIYPFLEARGVKLSHLRRMSWGMLLCALSFFVSGILESEIQSLEEEGGEQKVDFWWQIPQITILAVAEIFLSVSGYDFAYSNSPASMKAIVTAVYLLTTAVGDFFGGILYSSVFHSLNRATAMHTCAVLMLGNLGLFCWVARWWECTEAEKEAENTILATGGEQEMVASPLKRDADEFEPNPSFKGIEISKDKQQLKLDTP